MKRKDNIITLKQDINEYLSGDMYVRIRLGDGLPSDEFYISQSIYVALFTLAKLDGKKETCSHAFEKQKPHSLSRIICSILLFLRTLIISVKYHYPIHLCGKLHWTIEMANYTWHFFVSQRHCISPFPPRDSNRDFVPINRAHFIQYLPIVDTVMPWLLETITQTKIETQKEWTIWRIKDAAKGLVE